MRPKGSPKTPGSGRTKGTPNKRTVEADELLRLFRARVAAEFGPLQDALIQAAKGVQHLQAKDRNGQWTEVTDPVIMAKVLNSGEQFYRISARNPDVRALKDIFDRLWGLPKQAVDVNVDGELHLVERLARARQRGQT